jgi:outer membrane protein
MTRTKTFPTLTAAVVLAALGSVAAPVRAQQISEARIKELIKQAATSSSISETTVQPPGTATGESRPTVHMTLDEAVKFALDRNLDIAVQRLNPEINDIAVASISSVYHPSLTSVISQSQTNDVPRNILQLNAGGTGTSTDLTTYNGGIAQSIKWGGGSLQVTLNNGRNASNSNTNLFNPAFTSTWSGIYNQPLLRNFRIDSTRQQLAVTKINRDISDIQVRATITNTLSNVRNAYWDYVFAVQAVEVAQKSLDLASKLVQDNQTRVEIGTMAPIDVVQAQSEQATRRQALVTAISTKRTAELALKRLIVSGTQDPNWIAEIDPTDRPEFSAEPIDIESAVRRALSERTDLEIAKKNITTNDVTLKYLVDQMRPQIDLQATYGLAGIGGPFLRRNTSVIGGTVDETVPGGIADAFSSLFQNRFPRWTVALNMSYPLGVSSQEASVARARVQMNQVQAQMKQIELQVATDVTNAAVTAQSAAEAVQASQAAREFAQKKLEAEQSKFEVGMSTNYFVVQAQRDLSDAQNSELRQILNYRKALVELERLQQTTLQNLNVTVVNAGGGGATGAATVIRGGQGQGGQGGGGGQ